jgi:hypothetical protein
VFLSVLFLAAVSFAQGQQQQQPQQQAQQQQEQPYPFRVLDSRQFDAKADPGLDMFMGNWRDSMPRLMHGNLVFRDMLIALEGPDTFRSSGACRRTSPKDVLAPLVSHSMSWRGGNREAEGVSTARSSVIIKPLQ